VGYFKQSDPFFFAPQISVLFPSTGFQKMIGSPSSGDLTVMIGQPLFAKIRATAGSGLVIDRRELDATSAASYTRIFEAAIASMQLPFLLGPLSLIPVVGAAITIATSVVDGLNRISTTTVDADQLTVLMANGGAFSKVYSIATSGGEPRLTMTIVYAVSVGKEARLYQIMTSVYAVAPMA
jgi:hypothetical protein